MNATALRTPYWSRTMTARLNDQANSPRSDDSTQTPQPIDEKVLRQLGLANLTSAPSDPRLLAEHLKADDDKDSATDSDEFARGIRRAVRLQLAFRAKLHRHVGKTWKAWVSEHFKAGYPCYQRYHVAAELQVGLISRGLPKLESGYQSRVLAPFRKCAGFWDALSVDSLKNGFPPANELKTHLQSALGGKSSAPAPSPRIQLHRALSRIAKQFPSSKVDELVARALSSVASAIAVLEGKGAASSVRVPA